MEPNESIKRRLYSPGQIALAAFIGSPIAACWFFGRNYRELGKPESTKQWLVWGSVGTVALFAVIFILSFIVRINLPNQVIPIGYTFGLREAAKRIHGSTVTEHLSAGGRLGSWWFVVGLSLLFLIAVAAVWFGVCLALLPQLQISR